MCGLTHQTDIFLAFFNANGFLVQEIGGVFNILVIWVVILVSVEKIIHQWKTNSTGGSNILTDRINFIDFR